MISYFKNYKCKFSDFNRIKQKLSLLFEVLNILFCIFEEVLIKILLYEKDILCFGLFAVINCLY